MYNLDQLLPAAIRVARHIVGVEVFFYFPQALSLLEYLPRTTDADSEISRGE